MNCNQESCPVLLGSQCVFYESTPLPYIGINTNDSLQVILGKIDVVIGELEGLTQSTQWGDITGNINNQTDLISYLNSTYYPLTNPSNFIPGSNVPTYEADPVFTAWLASVPNISLFNNNVGYITSSAANNSYWKLSSGGVLTADNTISGNFNKFFTGTGGFVIGHSALTNLNTRLQVRGTGITTDKLFLFEDNLGAERLKLLDNGTLSGTTSAGMQWNFGLTQSTGLSVINTLSIASVDVIGITSQLRVMDSSGNTKGRFIYNGSAIQVGFESLDITLPVTVSIPVVSNTSGEYSTFRIKDGGSAFNPSSGNAVFKSLLINPQYEVTGGTTTIYGIDYNPTMTSVTGSSIIAFRNTQGSFLIGNTTLNSSNPRIQVTGYGVTTGITLMTEGSSGILSFSILDNGNVGIGTSTFGTGANKTLAILNGIGPADSPSNSVQLWAEDLSSSSKLKMRDEAGNNGFVPIVLYGSASLDFPNTSPSSASDLTITVVGAAVGDSVSLGVPNGSVLPASNYSAWVSAIDTITIRFNNYDAVSSQNPSSGTFKVTVFKF